MRKPGRRSGRILAGRQYSVNPGQPVKKREYLTDHTMKNPHRATGIGLAGKSRKRTGAVLAGKEDGPGGGNECVGATRSSTLLKRQGSDPSGIRT